MFWLLLQQLYSRLSELLGLHDHLLLLDFFVQKIARNLKCYTEVVIFWSYFILSLIQPNLTSVFFLKSEEVIDHTLSLFLELASGLGHCHYIVNKFVHFGVSVKFFYILTGLSLLFFAVT